MANEIPSGFQPPDLDIPFSSNRVGAESKREPKTAVEVISIRRDGGKSFKWGELHLQQIEIILQKASEETEVPVSMFNRTEFLKPLEIIGGHSLSGLYNVAQNDKERGERDVIDFILDRIGIKVTVEDVIKAIKMDRNIEWKRVPPEQIKALLVTVVKESIAKPVEMLSLQDITTRYYETLGGRNLYRLYASYARKPERNQRNVTNFLLESLGVDVAIHNKIRRGGRASAGVNKFLTEASPDEVKELLEKAAEEIGKPVAMLNRKDLESRHFDFLNGRMLAQRRGKGATGKHVRLITLLERAQLKATVNDVIEIAKRGDKIPWQRISMDVIYETFVKAAAEIGVPASMMRGADTMHHYFKFLGNRTLGGLYTYALRHPEKLPEESSMMFIRRKLGLPEINLSRKAFRVKKIQDSFTQQVSSSASSEEVNIERFMPWINSISRLYESPFLDIEREEIESEAIIFVLDALKAGMTEAGLIKTLPEHLERFRKRSLQPRYKEKLLSTPIAEGLTLQDVISTKDIYPEDQELSETLLKSLKNLSPLQEKIVLAIAVEEISFEELRQQLDLDEEVLEEHYQDALTLLRTIMTPEGNE